VAVPDRQVLASRFDDTIGTVEWSVYQGELDLDCDLEAERLLVELGGGNPLLVALAGELAAIVPHLNLPDGTDLAPWMRAAYEVTASEGRARHPGLPDDCHPVTLWLLTTSTDPLTASAVAAHRSTPPLGLARLLDRWSVPKHLSWQTRRFGNHFRVLAALASNVMLTVEQFRTLALVDSLDVLFALVGNPSCPPTVLHRLRTGPPGPVRDAARQVMESRAG
jgi:hypothetical protein